MFVAVFGYVGLGLIRAQTNPESWLTNEDKYHMAMTELRGPRGEVFDSGGRLLAKDRQADSLWANPAAFEDPNRATTLLGRAFGVDEQTLLERLTGMDENGTLRKFVWVKRWLSPEDIKAYERLPEDLKAGLALQKENVRFYPENDLAAHVVGFVNRDGLGCEGIELALDKQLRCIPGKRKSRVDARRRFLDSLMTLEYVEQRGGEQVHLTIDKGIQHSLETSLDKALVDCEAPRGMGIVLDPKTGAILALACRPAFNPNNYADYEPEIYKNRAVIDVFEPGSAFKIVTFAAALEHGLVTPDTLIDCENGSFNPYGHRIRDFHKLGVVPLYDAFRESSNIATLKLAAMLGEERFEQWMHRFGFGEKACQDFQTESRGILRPRTEWTKRSMGALPIGQEMAVTITQLARAFCVIANGGHLVRPYVVERVVDREGSVTYQHRSEPPQRVLSEHTAATMRDLCHLVCTGGTGERASIAEFRTGGKTGTAQIARPDGKGYYPDKYTTIFAGFAPLRDPRLVSVILVQEPAIKLHYGGYVCGPVFREVVRDTLIRMDCPLDPVEDPDPKPAPAPIEEETELEDADTVLARAEEIREARNGLGEAALEPQDLSDDPDYLLREMALTSLDGSAPIANEPRLSDLRGMTKRQAKAYVDTLGMRWDMQGAGRVVSQYPPAGTPLRDVASCRLVFSSDSLEERESLEEMDESQSSADPVLIRAANAS